ncbi:hypothetical protein GCM10010313_65350 [Streptomyces violarus]|uniref:Uncharacterized protein n=1 Tax=Streptomyces violarus TaxID=67380 RepID=A0A7W4ZVU3_9ACTN|nr:MULTISPECIES: hypothetical protein [Streptomyces]MBB3079401.1 hypothetical protein [Streptomyces violarus]WRU01942.1 hypothetical protein VJ737_31570 [Streptomyces sp. CGMCC 4.1772]GHD26482.1 hypothetical protein GCM10010313_65350 [Streptomyces violarus]
MGIRTLLSRTAPGVALPPVRGYAAGASTLRVPATLTTALRRTTTDLRNRMALGRRATDSAGPGGLPTTGPTSPSETGDLPGSPETPGETAPRRAWADRARGYLTLVLTLLPRPRPAHTTITVYIVTTEPLSERPDGSAPYRRHGQDRRGPEPGAAP